MRVYVFCCASVCLLFPLVLCLPLCRGVVSLARSATSCGGCTTVLPVFLLILFLLFSLFHRMLYVVPILYDDAVLHRPLCLLHNNVVSLWRSFVDHRAFFASL